MFKVIVTTKNGFVKNKWKFDFYEEALIKYTNVKKFLKPDYKIELKESEEK